MIWLNASVIANFFLVLLFLTNCDKKMFMLLQIASYYCFDVNKYDIFIKFNAYIHKHTHTPNQNVCLRSHEHHNKSISVCMCISFFFGFVWPLFFEAFLMVMWCEADGHNSGRSISTAVAAIITVEWFLYWTKVINVVLFLFPAHNSFVFFSTTNRPHTSTDWSI